MATLAERCQSCGSGTVAHCLNKRCRWRRCPACKSYGTETRWVDMRRVIR